MSRVVHLKLEQDAVVTRCQSENVGVSAIEPLSSGGVRLVCMSSEGAERIRTKLRRHLIAGDVTRAKHRPSNPHW